MAVGAAFFQVSSLAGELRSSREKRSGRRGFLSPECKLIKACLAGARLLAAGYWRIPRDSKFLLNKTQFVAEQATSPLLLAGRCRPFSGNVIAAEEFPSGNPSSERGRESLFASFTCRAVAWWPASQR